MNSQPNQYVSVLASFQTIGQQYSSPVTNANNWIFFFTNTALVISRASIIQNFVLPTALFSQSGIFDSQNETIPYATFEGFRFETRCGAEKSLTGPFVLEINQYWPVVTIYDQEGSAIFEYAVGSSEASYNPCPEELFLLDNKCVSTCPQ